MIFSNGPLDIYKSEEHIIGLATSFDGLTLVTVSPATITVWRGGRENWAVVGVLKHPATLDRECSRCQIAWKSDSTAFIVVYKGEEGRAEFYSLDSVSGHGVSLSLPRWSKPGSQPALYQLKKIRLTARLPHTSSVNGSSVTAVASNRFRVLIGTADGAVTPVLWTGEVVQERKINVASLLPEFQGSKESGVCCVFKHTGSDFIVVESSGCSAISLSAMRNMLLVGHDGTRVGDITIYTLAAEEARIVRQVRLGSLGLRAGHSLMNSRVEKLLFCSDSNISSFAASYAGLGIVVWSLNGSKFASTVPEARGGKGNPVHVGVLDFAWALHGFRLLGTSALVSDQVREGYDQSQSFWQMELVKLSVPVYSPTANDCVALIGDDYIKLLGTRDWDTHCLEWHNLEPPIEYIKENWPLRYLAVSPDQSQVALAGKHGAVLLNRSTGRWRLFGNINTERSIICSGLFWYDPSIICIINREGQSQKDAFSLLFYPRNHLDDYSRLCCFRLPARPVSLDLDIHNNCMVIQYRSVLEIYHISMAKGLLSLSKLSDDITGAEITILKERTIPLFDEVLSAGFPSQLQLLPCGYTRIAGSRVKLPKCLCLTALGTLLLLDTEQGSVQLLATDIERVLTSCWTNFQNSLKSNPVLLSNRTTVNIPGAVLFSVWLCDKNGLRLWLPALDFGGEIVDSGYDYFDPEVLPSGIIETHGVAVGITQRRGQLPGGNFCFQIGIRIQPAVHCLLHWLLRAQKFDLGSDVLVQASQRLSLFQESIELLIHGAVENDCLNGKENKLLPSVLKLLRQGKATMIIPNQFFAAIVASCARKLEASRWNYLFELVGSPEQFFNECIYYGQLRTASYFLLIADHYSPEKAKARLSALRYSAEEKEDTSLLKEIEHYEALRSRTIDGSF